MPPRIADGVAVYHLDPAAGYAPQVGAVPGGTRLRPALAFRCNLRYDDTRAGIDELQEWEAIAPIADGGIDPAGVHEVDYDERDFKPEPPAGALYLLTKAPLDKASFFQQAARNVEQQLADARALQIFRNVPLKLYARPGETQEQFAARCSEAAHAKADEEVAKIRDRLETRKQRLEDALLTARRQLAEADAEAQARQQQEMAAGAGALLGALLGGRSRSRALSQILGGGSGGAAAKARAQARAGSALAKAQDKASDLAELEQELAAEIAEITAKWDAKAAEIEPLPIRLESADIRVTQTALVWIPGA